MISVCIATYNGSQYIRRQLESIIAQLSGEDEIIISDDGSSDTTLEIIRELSWQVGFWEPMGLCPWPMEEGPVV